MRIENKASSLVATSTVTEDRPRSGVARERVAGVQRSRMLVAMAAEVSEHGVASASVANVVARAGVSRRTFYEVFDDRDDCFAAAFEDALGRVARRVLDSHDPRAPWVERVRSALTAVLVFLEEERASAVLLVVGSLAAGPHAQELRSRVLAQLCAAVDEGRGESRAGASLPPLTAEGVVGGALSILHARLAAPTGRDGELLSLAPALMGMIVFPYLGAAAARREAARPSPPRVASRRPPAADPLLGLDMRLTYRTMLVLRAVADRPGASNRRVGEAAEIGDQGQVSKLLARLQRLGLVENSGGAPLRGEPNAWRLTPRGAAVHESLVAMEG